MPVFCVEIVPIATASSPTEAPVWVARLRSAGLRDLRSGVEHRLYLIEGELDAGDAAEIAREILADPVTERSIVHGEGAAPAAAPGTQAIEVHLKPGVMDPVALTTLQAVRGEGFPVSAVRTARRYVLSGPVDPAAAERAIAGVLANDCIERIIVGGLGATAAPQPPAYAFSLRHVAIRGLDDAALQKLSRQGHLFLSLEEIRAIRDHFVALGREPTDLELETLAQTWSEHCVHKTLKSAIRYRGAPFGAVTPATAGAQIGLEFDNLLRDTIASATNRLIEAGRGPQCLSVFKDNAGVIAFDDDNGVAFKVETHNRPSAIEPYGGAATGIGGVIRDVLGCGLGARPIANTDVFCVAPGDWPEDKLPAGVLHPRRVLAGISSGVADYGNRMGIPTVNGAVHFNARYLGNPLVYCGCLGLIPRDKIEKAARPGDLVILVGGRTGRDGIHGATFSSAELTGGHADEFSHAVQIGNAIVEKRVLDAVLAARDADGGCLFTAITDCGAGGLSSAVGEMGAEVGVTVDLETVPLKYAGLRYDEIWISEAQERMVLAVPPENRAALLKIMSDEEVEATVIGTFGQSDAAGRPELLVRYKGEIVGQLDMAFVHDGVPMTRRDATWTLVAPPAPELLASGMNGTHGATPGKPEDVLQALHARLASPTVAGKLGIIRQYDHEVQAGSVIKPLCGPGEGPSDAAVLRPRLDSQRGVAVGCGLCPELGDIDPYWMALAAIDEALRNVVCVGGNPDNTAILDNFCWGRCDDPQTLGALVRACVGCRDGALAYGVPFVSGKDSLNNEFALDADDVDAVLATLRPHLPTDPTLRAALEERVRATKRIAIPHTLLISAVSIVDDVRRCVSADLKAAGHEVLLIVGQAPFGFDLAAAAQAHRVVAEQIRKRHVAACKDVGDGGWLVALAEMAIAGLRGVTVSAPLDELPGPLLPRVASYVVEARDAAAVRAACKAAGLACATLGRTADDGDLMLTVGGRSTSVAALRAAWRGQSPG